MIDRIKGVLIEKNPGRVVVDCSGVGYGLNITLYTYEKLGTLGSEANLYTYLHVAEGIMQMYGFSRQTERDMFFMLLSVSKIGPKMALAILSGISVENLVRAVKKGDKHSFPKISGVGGMTIERIIVELKKKIDKIDIGQGEGGEDGPRISLEEGPANEAIKALESLGYKRIHAETAIERVIKDSGADQSVEELIKKALKYI
ncbi:MAG: Holliday junction DNA helicase RuvA [Candidatus Raymondbacteria bacterium RifOxyA12_full_50_37]|uniref:Holliday junction branch migration complex subunit RuvA n=1 Tax=Candidatus Raymondbacteria bacterium RIFOXYD12_FULL_49_13 TaxID=1817890 RepID=A0A1F7F5N3_UNCRA|nr:MAG: Holliday junction DNA helicase RuvA [Candidatus Raymondbacteria bacterium RifOxyA12_full_50_37]OGJ89155.1 MAG: Holliday junction DNA helicase RuvA [Candidatus Raymondbacteria bacterium RIFOXYA2_FULL_49_16]OGJ96637.1 MAG: Holliday junction DNA helicase RuvA [Candidatus Raymondbacteria bacterium RIFOXYC2_FULL_50_21]OGJ97161.1 MAG: Holliday junction DNA helicase RuvA [Candidatus Raymondbacteria bacterium RifOxyC12_full_50_8]OGK01949.1 MAG: Holliday junction DNA helicase RuvA [Candidatus Ra